ncbi:MAG TPA: DNA recombination protein RmuC [Candidatus Poseidoniales archaeon]|nr:DNA recombination protein RmuC [Euryarchaeota archaeon]DAC24874.1 MAG TPA: DNA recombination protein RmuC [Candidatus Poseidoniales archaeon]HII52928.1 DNA recombination protein RmuC [Candidatus Thalassarchaeaceae archaeon]
MSSIELAAIVFFGLALIIAVWRLFSQDDSNRDSELRREIREMGDSQMHTLQALGKSQQEHLAAVSENIEKLKEGNEKKLDEMRLVVDEKLQSTLEKRIGESFKQVSERLEAVQRGLGEMQALATDTADLKKVLANVSTRGAMGEIQAEQILQSILSPNQYGKNVKTHPDCRGQVEFAIKLPGSDGNLDDPVWLPIDCKFPKEDYERLLDALDEGDKDLIEKAYSKFESNVTNKAKTIRKEYVSAPHTTDFAVMFLPTEGLYADVVRRPGLFEKLQRDCQIVVTGPSTLAAFVNSLQMGFRTLALEASASEVWNVLGAVKTEFVKFGGMMDTLHRQLNTAANTIGGDGKDSVQRRLRAMERKLKDVESIPSSSTNLLEGLNESDND